MDLVVLRFTLVNYLFFLSFFLSLILLVYDVLGEEIRKKEKVLTDLQL